MCMEALDHPRFLAVRVFNYAKFTLSLLRLRESEMGRADACISTGAAEVRTLSAIRNAAFAKERAHTRM